MHDVDRTQLEIQEAEVQDEILKKAFGRVAAWLRRQPSTPLPLPPQSPGRISGRAEEVREKLVRAHAMLEGLVRDRDALVATGRADRSIVALHNRAIANQQAEIRRLDAQLHAALRGG